MLRLHKNKIVILLVSAIFIVIFVVGFFYQFEVDYSDYKRIERIDGDGFQQTRGRFSDLSNHWDRFDSSLTPPI